jgi:hypothetical protein
LARHFVAALALEVQGHVLLVAERERLDRSGRFALGARHREARCTGNQRQDNPPPAHEAIMSHTSPDFNNLKKKLRFRFLSAVSLFPQGLPESRYYEDGS